MLDLKTLKEERERHSWFVELLDELISVSETLLIRNPAEVKKDFIEVSKVKRGRRKKTNSHSTATYTGPLRTAHLRKKGLSAEIRKVLRQRRGFAFLPSEVLTILTRRIQAGEYKDISKAKSPLGHRVDQELSRMGRSHQIRHYDMGNHVSRYSID